MTAKGKINASKVQAGDRILVDTGSRVHSGDECGISRTKTGGTTVAARVLDKLKATNVRGYVVITTAGRFYADPIETMWLAPEDAAGVKRAHVEALAEGAARPVATPAAEEMDEPSATAQAAQPVPTATVTARPTASRALMLQAAGRVLRAPELTFQLPLLPYGRDLVRLADLRQVSPLAGLTLNSQAGKVVHMSNEASTQTAPAQKHTGSTVVALIERVWDRIRADHPELPEVVVTTGSGEGVKWGHFRPESWKLAEAEGRMHEFFLASEALAKGATQVLQTTIHEAAHTLSKARGIQDTSRQGRWHNAEFKKAAVELGLEHKASTADKTHGFSFVTLTEATKVKYADLLAELDSELKLTGLLPLWLGGTDEEDQGGERITGKPAKGEGEDGAKKSGNLKAVCECEEPVIIRLSQKVLDLGVVQCTDCETLFRAA